MKDFFLQWYGWALIKTRAKFAKRTNKIRNAQANLPGLPNQQEATE